MAQHVYLGLKAKCDHRNTLEEHHTFFGCVSLVYLRRWPFAEWAFAIHMEFFAINIPCFVIIVTNISPCPSDIFLYSLHFFSFFFIQIIDKTIYFSFIYLYEYLFLHMNVKYVITVFPLSESHRIPSIV